MTSSDDKAVLAANEAFYRAFRERDSKGMSELWADRPETTCVHPGWDALFGYDAVVESWKGILSNPNAPRVECRDARAFLIGEVAYVVCHEILAEGVLAATNIFAREKTGDWKILHHQASPMAVSPKQESRPPGSSLH